MKRIKFLLTALCFQLGFISCDSNGNEETGIPFCGTIPTCTNSVLVLAVDFTTDTFLYAYFQEIPENIKTLSLKPVYNAPGDFGSITWAEAASNTKIFSGTIVWGGKGEQTYPEFPGFPASSFLQNYKLQPQPVWRVLTNEGVVNNAEVGGKTMEWLNLNAIWPAISQFEIVQRSTSEPFYIYLYQPSVGIGDPKDWYWLIFAHYNKDEQ